VIGGRRERKIEGKVKLGVENIGQGAGQTKEEEGDHRICHRRPAFALRLLGIFESWVVLLTKLEAIKLKVLGESIAYHIPSILRIPQALGVLFGLVYAFVHDVEAKDHLCTGLRRKIHETYGLTIEGGGEQKSGSAIQKKPQRRAADLATG
jgi:hypothetical protein